LLTPCVECGYLGVWLCFQGWHTVQDLLHEVKALHAADFAVRLAGHFDFASCAQQLPAAFH
jgi:hypothetical protein